MSEITALFRISLARHRWFLAALVVAVIVGVIVALVSSTWNPGLVGDQVAILALFLSLMPAGLASIVLFDYGLDRDLNLPGSGCSHWILRMPIHDWKIAIVPVVLKTIWITTLWILFVMAARRMGADEIPVIMPAVVFSAIAIWMTVLSWRPFTSSFRRFAVIVIAIPILYFALVGTFASPTIRQVEWRTTAITASTIAGIALYLGGVWCLIASTTLARTSPGGIVPAEGPRRMEQSNTIATWDAGASLPVRRYRSPLEAMFHHDYQKSREWIRRLYALLVVPTILVLILLVPVNSGSVIVSLMLFAYYAAFAGSRSFASPSDSQVLPVYLAASPLSTKTLAWGRQLFPLVATLCTYLSILLVIGGWACWETNREAWMKWAEAQSGSLGGDIAPFAVGIRLSIAIVLGVGVVMLGRLAAFCWVGLTGRTWVAIVVSSIVALSFLIPFGLALTWFMKQTDWESTRASAMRALALLPSLVGVLLLIKAVLTSIISYASVRQQLVTLADLVRVITAWLALTVGLATFFFLLAPYPFATLPWCLALTALAIPLARLVALPLALSWNRHR